MIRNWYTIILDCSRMSESHKWQNFSTLSVCARTTQSWPPQGTLGLSLCLRQRGSSLRDPVSIYNLIDYLKASVCRPGTETTFSLCTRRLMWDNPLLDRTWNSAHAQVEKVSLKCNNSFNIDCREILIPDYSLSSKTLYVTFFLWKNPSVKCSIMWTSRRDPQIFNEITVRGWRLAKWWLCWPHRRTWERTVNSAHNQLVKDSLKCNNSMNTDWREIWISE